MADDIAHWLEGLGLGQYAQAFAENGVNFDALPYLTEDDLKDLGLVLGHRRILQAAINSMTAVFWPSLVSRAASDGPDWPVPMITASYRSLMPWPPLFAS